MSSSSNNPNTSNTSTGTSRGGRKKLKGGEDSSTQQASSTAPSSSANNVIGFNSTNKHLRSILIHPIGLILASILNKGTLSEKLFTLWSDLRGVNEEWRMYQSCRIRDAILASAMSEWNQKGEVDLTKKIMDNIEKQTQLDGFGATSLEIEAEKQISGIGGTGKVTGKFDFLISKKCNDSGANESNEAKKSVVMIVEFGMDHGKWWQKLSQALTYVDLLRAGDDVNYIIDQPMLLTVVTMKQSCSDAKDTSDANPVAQFGMFLLIPKDDGKEYRLALLWRVDALDVDDASKQFGKTLYAAQCCVEWRENLESNIMNSNAEPSYQYLGPNCCRIGRSVSISIFVLLVISSCSCH